MLLYYLVTGSFPVKATDLDDLRKAHTDGRRVRLQDARADLPDGFMRVVERAIAPQQRSTASVTSQAELTPAFGAETLEASCPRLRAGR